jgi:hypothetical protein
VTNIGAVLDCNMPVATILLLYGSHSDTFECLRVETFIDWKLCIAFRIFTAKNSKDEVLARKYRVRLR